MKSTPLEIPDVQLLEPRVFEDSRGSFFESYNERVLSDLGIPGPFVQDNQSFSWKAVVRGLHYQIRQPQGKLIRCLSGEIFDVAVDLRRDSPTFCKWVGQVLNSRNRHMLWIPPGFAHGFMVLSEGAEVLYKATDFWAPQHERTLLWNDPILDIKWPHSNEAILSAKDLDGLSLAEAAVYEQPIQQVRTPSVHAAPGRAIKVFT
jgi:dTDP-4-dehydrorhamnose 3,5-epimerase